MRGKGECGEEGKADRHAPVHRAATASRPSSPRTASGASASTGSGACCEESAIVRRAPVNELPNNRPAHQPNQPHPAQPTAHLKIVLFFSPAERSDHAGLSTGRCAGRRRAGRREGGGEGAVRGKCTQEGRSVQLLQQGQAGRQGRQRKSTRQPKMALFLGCGPPRHARGGKHGDGGGGR